MALEKMLSTVAEWIPARPGGRAISVLCYHGLSVLDGG